MVENCATNDEPIKFGIKIFYQSLLKVCHEKDDIIKFNMAKLAKKIEKGIFINNGSNHHDNRYKSCCRNKLLNLKRNSEFARKIINGDIKAEDVYKLKDNEMLSWGKYYQNKIKLEKKTENIIRTETDLVPMKLEADGSLGSCLSGGSGGTVWVSRDVRR
ncbi:hypothetical protein C1645_741734 [Glomus cerebriforme]|uniref:TFIIS central domain-containing protein n=1 Tax=Glomus cerebriforme TaxID=658196 RepID=A0A397SMD3_9GLOM|nr:hypothetical protein C1645_741734 [Glomus cerebriforme]